MPKSSERPLLLDTHVWLWFVEGDGDRLAASIPRRLERAAHQGTLLVSAISLWEIGMLSAKGRVAITDLPHWILTSRRVPGIRVTPVDDLVAVGSAELPAPLHGDPADRLIAATARELDATLVTCDAELIAYGALGRLRVMDARAGG
ncbi:MAG: type II toxin-antitoxin system VapC family toxin [Gemmatimonadales bacterium]